MLRLRAKGTRARWPSHATAPVGRIPRGASARSEAEPDAFLRKFRVVTPLDHRDPMVARRSDVMAAWRRDLRQDAPWPAKDIGPVVSSLHGGGGAAPVAELRPLLTAEG